MPVYKVFTWNMQRAQSVSRPRQDAMIMERYRVLRTVSPVTPTETPQRIVFSCDCDFWIVLPHPRNAKINGLHDVTGKKEFERPVG